jgi:hypothetical protein
MQIGYRLESEGGGGKEANSSTGGNESGDQMENRPLISRRHKGQGLWQCDISILSIT